jgi:cell division protein FtsI (penicillin-binding protein 3)
VIGAARLVWVARGWDGEREKAQKIIEACSVDTTKIEPIRGNIFAHDERLLATTSFRYNLYTDFNANGLHDSIFDKSVDSLAIVLNNILPGKTVADYAKELRADRQKAKSDASHRTHRYRKLATRAVDYAELKQLKQLSMMRRKPNSGGLIVMSILHRIHPHGDMARNTIGRTNANSNGYIGIEAAYNTQLCGTPGMELRQQTTGRNSWIPVSSKPQITPMDGCDIVTTLDVDMQTMVESVIAEHLKSNEYLQWGTAVVMEVATGEIRAIANKRRKGESIVEDDNYALNYRKDPGSTFKLASYMVMLEKGMNLTDAVNTGDGTMVLYDKSIEDETRKGGMMSLIEAFEKSSNVGTVRLIQQAYPSKSGERDFAERIEALKLKDVSRFDLSPTQRIEPSIKSADKFSGLTLAMMSIGYELEVTPLQTLALYNAVANHGEMVMPRFIKALRQEERVVKIFPKQVVNKSICSEKTLRKLHQMLLGVVENGSAQRARSKSFQIAGKTGTAHVAEDKRGYTNQKLASFAGYFPADAPKYSCIVAFKTIDTPVKLYGGVIAAPVFKEIAESVYAHSLAWNLPVKQKTEPLEAPYVKSGRHDKMRRVLNVLQIPILGENEAVPWVSARPDGHEVAVQEKPMIQNLVPDVNNMGLRDAIYLLENAGLRVIFSGKGTVKAQNPMPGTACKRGDEVRLTMTYSS